MRQGRLAELGAKPAGRASMCSALQRGDTSNGCSAGGARRDALRGGGARWRARQAALSLPTLAGGFEQTSAACGRAGARGPPYRARSDQIRSDHSRAGWGGLVVLLHHLTDRIRVGLFFWMVVSVQVERREMGGVPRLGCWSKRTAQPLHMNLGMHTPMHAAGMVQGVEL